VSWSVIARRLGLDQTHVRARQVVDFIHGREVEKRNIQTQQNAVHGQKACGHDVCGAVGSHCYRIRVRITYHDLGSGVQVCKCHGRVIGNMKIPRSEQSHEVDLMPTDFSMRSLHDS
jgi:hypothetical protein